MMAGISKSSAPDRKVWPTPNRRNCSPYSWCEYSSHWHRKQEIPAAPHSMATVESTVTPNQVCSSNCGVNGPVTISAIRRCSAKRSPHQRFTPSHALKGMQFDDELASLFDGHIRKRRKQFAINLVPSRLIGLIRLREKNDRICGTTLVFLGNLNRRSGAPVWILLAGMLQTRER